MSGPALDTAAAWDRQLYVLYVYAADHGSRAGSMLLDAVVDPAESVALWVADPNPRRGPLEGGGLAGAGLTAGAVR